MSNVAGTQPGASEARRFRWRIVPAFILFLCGGFLGIGGAIGVAAVLYRAIHNSWSGIARADPALNEWVHVLLLSYSLMLVSGTLFALAAYLCATGRWWFTIVAGSVAAVLYACFFVIFPGPVPL